MSMVVLGSIFVDIKGYPFDVYIPGGRNSGRVEHVHGGVSRNIAEDLANIGLPCRFLSLADDTGTGAEVIERLKQHHVDTRYIRRVPDGMGCWLAIFDNDGDVIAAISKRPDLTPLDQLMDEQGDEIFRDADSILLEIDMEASSVNRVFRYADRYRIPVYAAVSNMSIAAERRELLQRVDCLVCNEQEAGILFGEDYEHISAAEMADVLSEKIRLACIPRMVVTMGPQGAAYADLKGNKGTCPTKKVVIRDTTGAGDAFFAGCAAGLTYGLPLGDSCAIGTRLALSVITSLENVCPLYRPEEFHLPVLKRDWE